MTRRLRTPASAWRTLGIYREHTKHFFWSENFSYTEIFPTRLTAHRQITDAWPAELAKRKDGKLATPGEPHSALWLDPNILVPV